MEWRKNIKTDLTYVMGNLCVKKRDFTIHNVPPPSNFNPGVQDLPDSDKEESKMKLSSSPAFQSDITSISNLKIVVALFTYNARDRGDLSFLKGDRLGILDDSDADWWQACHLTQMTEGLVPYNYVAPENTLESNDWFFGHVSRKDAEVMLMNVSNPRGTFLIRNQQTACAANGAYTLSVHDWEHEQSDHVKHYKIKVIDNGGFYVTRRKTFITLQELVAYYSEDAYSLCHKLTIPCPKPKPHIWDLSLNTRDVWEISRSSLQLIRKLGSGNFGDVWYGNWKGTTEVAVKIVRSDTRAPSAFLQEATIIKKFRHEKLVSLFAVCSKEEPLVIVTEYMMNGSLLYYLRSPEGKDLRVPALIGMAAQIANGMAYLEKVQFIHRALAARNVLVGDNNFVKIADFGLATIIEDSENAGCKFCVKWASPEVFLRSRFSIKSDVWSYGILLYELITHGQVPYPGMPPYEFYKQVEGGYRMPKPTNCECPDPVYSMMLQCWDADPEKRPTFEFLFNFFDDYFVSTESSHHTFEDI